MNFFPFATALYLLIQFLSTHIKATEVHDGKAQGIQQGQGPKDPRGRQGGRALQAFLGGQKTHHTTEAVMSSGDLSKQLNGTMIPRQLIATVD